MRIYSELKEKTIFLLVMFLLVIFSFSCIEENQQQDVVLQVYSATNQRGESYSPMTEAVGIRYGFFEETLPRSYFLQGKIEELINSEADKKFDLKKFPPGIPDEFRLVIEGTGTDGNTIIRGISAPIQYNTKRSQKIPIFVSSVDSFGEIPMDYSESQGRPARMSAGRYGHTATLLPDGKVLILGGINQLVDITSYPDTADLYDPATNQFETVTVKGWSGGRAFHTLTVIESMSNRIEANGTLALTFVIVGGEMDGAFSNEVYRGTYVAEQTELTLEQIGTLTQGVAHHAAAAIPNTSAVVIAGGKNQSLAALTQAAVIEAAVNALTPVKELSGGLNNARYNHTLTALPYLDGEDVKWNVVAVGGTTQEANAEKPIVEVFSPDAGSFSCFNYETDQAECVADPCLRACRPSTELAYVTRSEHFAIPLYKRNVLGVIDESSDEIEAARIVVLGGETMDWMSGNIVAVTDLAFINAYGEVTCSNSNNLVLPYKGAAWDFIGGSYDTILIAGATASPINEPESAAVPKAGQIIKFVYSYDEGNEECRGLWDFTSILLDSQDFNGTETPYRTNDMFQQREHLTVTTLINGMVLIVGGLDVDKSKSGGEIYNPPSKNFYEGTFEFSTTF